MGTAYNKLSACIYTAHVPRAAALNLLRVVAASCGLMPGKKLRDLKAIGGSRGQKYLILILQYVIELEKTNQMQKTGG